VFFFREQLPAQIGPGRDLLVHRRILLTTDNAITYSRIHGIPTPENNPGCRPIRVPAESEKWVARRHGRLNLSSNPIEIALGDTVYLLTKVCSLRSSTLSSEVEGRKVEVCRALTPDSVAEIDLPARRDALIFFKSQQRNTSQRLRCMENLKKAG